MSQVAKEFPPTLSAFVPKQAALSTKKTTSSLSQDGPLQVARAAIAYLPSPTANARIHDNGCGDGNVSRTILSSLSVSAWPARIDATDIALAQPALDKLQAAATEQKWPVYTSVVSAQDLSVFHDEVFTASIANCVIYRLPDSEAKQAAREMYRTLRPDGTAIASIFGRSPHRAALFAAHESTRAGRAGPLVGEAKRWENGTLLEATIRAGGFSQVEVHESEATTIIENLGEWELGIWAVLGRPASGWLERDERTWDEALSIFDATLRKQPGFSILQSQEPAIERAELKMQVWIAVARK